jgi:hypothetical protein
MDRGNQGPADTSGMKAGLVAGLAIAVGAAGCASVDPTDPSHFTNVVVQNDTASSVWLVQCDVSCGTLHDRTRIRAGASTSVGVSNEGIQAGYVVERPSGSKLGCLYMRFNHVRGEHRVAISSLRACAR